MAVPESPAMNKFNFDCGHLYNDVGKLHGKNGERSISDAKESFFSWCKTRVAPPLWGNCNGLGDVLVMAMSARANSANVGGAKEFCSDTFLFLGMMNQAKVDLKLLPGAFPKPAALLSYSSIRKLILPSNLDAEVGPLRWALPVRASPVPVYRSTVDVIPSTVYRYERVIPVFRVPVRKIHVGNILHILQNL